MTSSVHLVYSTGPGRCDVLAWCGAEIEWETGHPPRPLNANDRRRGVTCEACLGKRNEALTRIADSTKAGSE